MITYIATNIDNGKFYVGSTNNIDRRKKEHLKSKVNYPFNNAYRNNPERFEWEIVEDDSEEPVMEQALLDLWFGTEQCYNLNPLANRPPESTGTTWWTNLESGVEKQSKTCPGDKWEQGRDRRKLEAAWESSRGRSMSDNQRQKISVAHKGRKRNEKTRTRMKESWRGKKWWRSPEGKTCRSVDCPGEGWLPGRFTSLDTSL